MDFALVYLVQRFFYRIIDFFHHWYVDGSRWIGHSFISTLAGIDKTMAIRITLKYFFHPLYKDYTIVGRILGVIFRTGRLLIGVVVYIVVAVWFLLIFIAWFLAPAAIIFYAATSF